jgi:hypothetical protein
MELGAWRQGDHSPPLSSSTVMCQCICECSSGRHVRCTCRWSVGTHIHNHIRLNTISQRWRASQMYGFISIRWQQDSSSSAALHGHIMPSRARGWGGCVVDYWTAQEANCTRAVHKGLACCAVRGEMRRCTTAPLLRGVERLQRHMRLRASACGERSRDWVSATVRQTAARCNPPHSPRLHTKGSLGTRKGASEVRRHNARMLEWEVIWPSDR